MTVLEDTIDIIYALVATALLLIVGIPLLILIAATLVVALFIGLLSIGIDKMIKTFRDRKQKTV